MHQKITSNQKAIPPETYYKNFQLNSAPADIPDMYSKPGTACNEYTGYCDVFQKCREVRLVEGWGVVERSRGCQNELKPWSGGRVRK